MPNFNQADFSEFVVHFTKSGAPYCAAKHGDQVADIVALSARDRLLEILTSGRLRATPMPWTNKRAACFTECTWPSLLGHAARYSSFGIGFRKDFIFRQGGGPAIYMRQDLLKIQLDKKGGFDPKLYAFVTPFAPSYAPEEYMSKAWEGREPCDYTHEREWRVATDLAFQLSDVAFVCVDTYEDMARTNRNLKDAIGRENWLILSNYRKIEQLWPQHRF